MYRYLALFVFCFACGSDTPTETSVPAPMCEEVEDTFDVDTGWGAEDYCSVMSVNGCYPFHGANENSCKSFISMRTKETQAEQITACRVIISNLNCRTYEGDDGDVSFFIDEEDRLTMRMFGTLSGKTFDTILHLNPCQPSCLSGITLETLNDDQQTVCEIPRQGQPVCLFPETAHNVTFKEAGQNRLNLVMGGKEHLLNSQ